MSAPKAYVHRFINGKFKKREGRGFSLGELKEAGITKDLARKLGIYIDERRRSVHEENVQALKKFLSSLSKDTSKGDL